VTGLTGVTQVAAGGVVSLALRSDGTVWAWGAYELRPVQVTGLAGVSQVSAGGRAFSLAVHTVPWLVLQTP